ncbi:MAG: beta-ketoacyl-ACP synthase [Pseudomonadota bacterium]
MKHDVVITGIGLLSSLGEGVEAHAELLNAAPANTAQPHGPFLIHPLCDVDFDRQIPKKGDQRQMEAWQRIGVYAAGLALDDAGIKGNNDLLSQTHMIVAAGGGERDEAVDASVLEGLQTADNKGAYLNERLMNDLRPTLFLAQLSNLLAGNISIVHGVTGTSRTFMGEELCGVDALRTLQARIAHGQAEIGLVGGAFNAARKDLMLNYAFEDLLLSAPFAPVWSRNERHGGMAMGSAGAFLVLESRDHAEKRGANIRAKLTQVETDRCSRNVGEMENSLKSLFEKLALQPEKNLAVLSCANGAAPITEQEENFWQSVDENVALRAIGTVAGHSFEAQAPFACALAALALDAQKFFAPFEAKEKTFSQNLGQVIVSCCGHWRGEGLMLLEKA